MRAANPESVQVCVERFAEFLQARDAVDRMLAIELAESVRCDDVEGRDRVLALAESCARAIREQSSWRLDVCELFPTFGKMVRDLTAEVRTVLEHYASRHGGTLPPCELAPE